MGGFFDDVFGGISDAISGIGDTVSNAFKNPGSTLLPILANAFLPGVGGVVGKALGGGALGSLGGKLATTFLGSALGGSKGGQNLSNAVTNGIDQIFPGGSNSDQLIKLISMFSGEKPEPPKLPTMGELSSTAMSLPFMANLQSLVNNNPNQQILPSLLAKANDNSTKTMIDNAINRQGGSKYLDNAIAALNSSRSRLADTFTGYGPERMKLMRENVMSDLGELSDTALKKVGASMAARGLTGGVMSNAQNLAMKDVGRTAQRALNELNISDAEAQRTDRWTKEGLLNDNANQTANAWLQGGGQAEDAMARLLGLRGAADESALKAAGMYSDVAQRGINNVMDAAKLGQTGIQSGMQLFGQGLDKYKVDTDAWSGLFSALGGNAAAPVQVPQPTIDNSGSFDWSSLLSGIGNKDYDLAFKYEQPKSPASDIWQNAMNPKSSTGSKYFTDPGSRFTYTPGRYTTLTR